MMLQKVLSRQKRSFTIGGAAVGMLIGLFLLLLSLQFYLDVNTLITDRRSLLSDEYLVVTKQVSLLNTFGLNASGFQEKEIEDLRKQQFVSDVGLFEFSRFKAVMSSPAMAGFPGMWTEVFFESIPNEFMDVDSTKWKWNKPGDAVPIVLPADYLIMYNFGYAPGSGAPQLTEEALSLLSFDLQLQGNGKTENMKIHLAGFSDRMSTLLVPVNFMNWANENFGAPEDNKQPHKLIVLTPDPSNKELQRYLETNGFQTNQEKLRGNKAVTLINAVSIAVAVVGIMLVFLSLLIFIVSLQLVIAKASGRIELLIRLGYDYAKISKHYIIRLVILLFVITCLVFAAAIYAKAEIISVFAGLGFTIEPGISSTVLFTGIGSFLLLFFINAVNIHFTIKKLA